MRKINIIFSRHFVDVADLGPIYDSSYPLTVDNGFYAGNWGGIQTCPTGTFVNGAQLAVSCVHSDLSDDCSDLKINNLYLLILV